MLLQEKYAAYKYNVWDKLMDLRFGSVVPLRLKGLRAESEYAMLLDYYKHGAV
jgi:hypothetical protein